MKKLIRTSSFVLLLLASVLVAPASFAADGESAAFDQVAKHYESVRLALTNDTTDGISEQSQQIEAILKELSADWSSVAAGVRADMAEDVRGLLPELSRAAGALTAATSLDAARDAFFDLSKPLVRWRKAVDGDKPVVAYCPMVKRSWLQPEGELGNPYYGQSMLRCGEVVDA